ncbi:MAG: type 1 glutamine amidotransferase, partial [Pyrinomonadaceae bacterium]
HHLLTRLKRERTIAALALENIVNNIKRLVVYPENKIVHLSELASAAATFRPEAILLSGSLSDFDFYHPDLIRKFGDFARSTNIPMLGICGGHQLLGLAFGARVVTLDKLEQFEQRERRIYEYQYRYVRIMENEDPIFADLGSDRSGLLRVWQNHGLQLDQVPQGFKLLATSYLCHNQMMVKRDDRQLIYSVQFHLEKSFEDWYKNRTRWQHPNDSRDGRIIFENFLKEALKWR